VQAYSVYKDFPQRVESKMMAQPSQGTLHELAGTAHSEFEVGNWGVERKRTPVDLERANKGQSTQSE
jgi:hypothetical protein